jgi:hypothetical protein
MAFFFCTVAAFFFATAVALLVTGVAFFFCTVTALFFGTGVFRTGFAGRVWRIAAEPAGRGRVFAADFTGRAAFRLTGFVVRAGLADLR